MTIETPEWYSNLKLWREENGCTGELWEIYVNVIQEKLKQYRFWFFMLGMVVGIFLFGIYLKLR